MKKDSQYLRPTTPPDINVLQAGIQNKCGRYEFWMQKCDTVTMCGWAGPNSDQASAWLGFG